MGQAFDEADAADVTTSENTTENTTENTGAEGATSEASATSEAKAEAKPEGPSTDELKAQFLAAVEGAISHEARDVETGALPEVALVEVKKVYGALPIRLKAWAREHITAEVPQVMSSGDWIKSRSLVEVLNAFKTAATPRPSVVKEPVDPTEEFTNRVAAHYLAPSLVEAPEGVAGEWASLARTKAEGLVEQVRDYLTWKVENDAKPEGERQETPEGLNPIIALALKIARGRGTASRASREGGEKGARRPRVSSGARRDVAAHIVNAFEGKPSGTFLTISEIVNTPSPEYGDEKPSAGAISARLFPGEGKESNVSGVTPVIQDGKKGATKN